MQEYGLYANILVYLHICLKGISCTEHIGKWSCAYLSPFFMSGCLWIFSPNTLWPIFLPSLGKQFLASASAFASCHVCV